MTHQVGHVISDKERTVDVINSANVTFKDLLLSQDVLSGLKKARFDQPSPIQLKAIPFGRCGLDLIVQAKSGTGKTCVFTVVALEAISANAPTLQVIILTPTREIAVQIEDVIKAIGQDIKGLVVSSFIGGRPVSDDRSNAKGCHIAVGSPGRIFQLIELDILKCENVRILILDEADKLLEQNFQSQINSIYSMLPTNKQMIAASATYPEELAEFATRYMRDPTFVRLNPKDMALLGIKQYCYKIAEPSDKFHSKFECKIKAVVELLEMYSFQQTLIFSNYHSHAKDLSDACNSVGLPATFISGNLEQERRLDAIKMLKEFKCRVLISTDLTSRGIDASNVDLVLNLDVPQDWETYMHRTGRAGRFGSLGAVISIVMTGKEQDNLFRIAKSCGLLIYPIVVTDGKVDFGTSPINVDCDVSNTIESTKVNKCQSTVSNPFKSKETSPPDKSRTFINMPKNENTLTSNSHLQRHVIHNTEDASANCQYRPKIPSLPELMLGRRRPNSRKFCYSYNNLLENLMYFKKHGSFGKLEEIEVEQRQLVQLSISNGQPANDSHCDDSSFNDSRLESSDGQFKNSEVLIANSLNEAAAVPVCSAPNGSQCWDGRCSAIKSSIGSKFQVAEKNLTGKQSSCEHSMSKRGSKQPDTSVVAVETVSHGLVSGVDSRILVNQNSSDKVSPKLSKDLCVSGGSLHHNELADNILKSNTERFKHKRNSKKKARSEGLQPVVSIPLMLPKYSSDLERGNFNKEYCMHCYLLMQRQYAAMWQNYFHCGMWKQWFDMQSFIQTGDGHKAKIKK